MSIDLPPLPPKKTERKKSKVSKPKTVKAIVDEVKVAELEAKRLAEEQVAKDFLTKYQGIINPDTVTNTVVKEEIKKRPVAFEPNSDKQIWFLQAAEDEVLFGGGRGSGKSLCLIADPLRYIESPNFRAVIIRRTMPELRELIDRAKNMYYAIVPSVQWKVKENLFQFPSGAKIEFGYLDSENDLEKYRGQEYTWIGIDEISQIPFYEWYYKLKASLRTSDPTLKTFLRACVDEGDVLTTKGWKPIQHVVTGDKVYSVDDFGNTVIKDVYATAEYDVDEDLVRIRKKNLYMSMTEDHRVMHKRPLYGIKLNRWNAIDSKSVNILRAPIGYTDATTLVSPIENLTPEEYCAFMGIYLAEGCVASKVHKGNYTVVITQQKEKNVQPIRDLLDKTKLKWCYCSNGDFKATNKILRSYLLQFGKAKDKFVPRNILENASKYQLQIIFDWLFLGDGCWQSKDAGTYTTTSPRLRDDVCEIAVKLGYKVQFSTKLHDNPKHNTTYNIFVVKKDEPTTLIEKERFDCKQQVYKERHKGKVYCISVKGTENFIIRQKGCIWVSGNTSNPTGVGIEWVKEYWHISEGKPNTTIRESYNTQIGVITTTKKWLHSTVYDNPDLIKANPQYVAQLMAAPPHLRKAWLDGDWDAIEGAAFQEFDKSIHVCKPFPIPHDWTKVRGADYGYKDGASCVWLAIDPVTGTNYVYRDFYCNGRSADMRERFDGPQFSRHVKKLEAGEYVKFGVIDSSIWATRGQSGPTIAEDMIKTGVKWRPSDKGPGSRVAGKNKIHQMLQVDSVTGKPGLIIFDTCIHTIKSLAGIPIDPHDAEDVDTDSPLDCIYDGLRYVVQSRPFNGYSQWTQSPLPPVNSKFGY